MTALTHLYLDHGLYTTLADGVFDGLSSLTFLRMSHNQLTNLSAGVFSELTALDTLSLHNNKFPTLPRESILRANRSEIPRPGIQRFQDAPGGPVLRVDILGRSRLEL